MRRCEAGVDETVEGRMVMRKSLEAKGKVRLYIYKAACDQME